MGFIFSELKPDVELFVCQSFFHFARQAAKVLGRQDD